MDKITKSILNSFVDQFDLGKYPEDKQFENFVNYCITTKLYRNSFELDDVHTGSGGDAVIDWLFFIVNGKLIIDEDELKDVVDSVNYLDADIIFIQSKTSNSFDGSQIGSFINGVKDFLDDKSELVHNEKIKKLKNIWDSVISMSSLMINRRPNCKLYYVCTGKWLEDKNLNAIRKRGQKDLDNLNLFDSIAIELLGAVDIQKLYNETKNKLSTTINFQNRVTLPDIEGISEAYLGVLPYNDYMKLIKDEKNDVIHNIFDDNVRDFQGDNPVNQKIKKTLEEGSYNLFCVLNNGITIVASDLTPAGNRFTIRDYQVVNGCQTSNVLFNCRNLKGIENVFVPIKIIVTDSDEVKTRITLANNSQTEVKTEQLEALNSFQRGLENYYNAEKMGITLHYERRSQQYNATGIKKSQIISIPIQIKCFASVFLNSPHLVSGYYGSIVKRFNGKFFEVDHKYLPYYVSALTYYKIEQYFRSLDIESDYKKLRFHIMFLVRLLTMGEHLDPLNSAKIEKKCETFKNILIDENKSLSTFKKAIDIINSSGIDENKKQYKAESDTDLLITAYRRDIAKANN